MKHQQAFLVILSYVIGFNTAFIAFGIADIDATRSYQEIESTELAATAPVGNTTETTNVSPSPSAQGAAVGMALKETELGLLLVSDVGERIISQRVEANASGMPGAHVAVHGVMISPDERFVHFCEQAVEVPTECNHYVYIVASHTVARVTADATPIRSDVATFATTWSDDGRLQINEYQSITVDQPWKMVKQ